MKSEFAQILDFVHELYGPSPVPLHVPRFQGNEKNYLLDVIDSTFVSSVGPYVNRFEDIMCQVTGAKYAIATVNGTAALHVCLVLAGVGPQTEVITQALTFVATANAISYCRARPVFCDVDADTMGLSPQAVAAFLESNAEMRPAGCFNRKTGARISACVPMHTFGHPCRIEELVTLCEHWKIPLVEDAAESLGSTCNQRHTGTFGLVGAVSLNGNKIVTCGGGGRF
jgi:dTDP-4-amino-4,6-dideoxygalactose transaminase